jgi:acetoin utilization protein AcuB
MRTAKTTARSRRAPKSAPRTVAPKTVTAADLMTADPDVVAAEMSLWDAASRMTGAEIRHLPVIDDTGRVVGILSDRDVRAAIGDPHEAPHHGTSERSLTVEDVMAKDPISISLETPLVEIATLLANERIGALPVLDEGGHPVGIVSTVDVLGHLARTLAPK